MITALIVGFIIGVTLMTLIQEYHKKHPDKKGDVNV